jgi:hypothetical protein
MLVILLHFLNMDRVICRIILQMVYACLGRQLNIVIFQVVTNTYNLFTPTFDTSPGCIRHITRFFPGKLPRKSAPSAALRPPLKVSIRKRSLKVLKTRKTRAMGEASLLRFHSFKKLIYNRAHTYFPIFTFLNI